MRSHDKDTGAGAGLRENYFVWSWAGARALQQPQIAAAATCELGRNVCKCTLEKTAGVRDGTCGIGTRRWRDFFPDPMRVQVRHANGRFLPPNILDRMKSLPNRICAGGEIA